MNTLEPTENLYCHEQISDIEEKKTIEKLEHAEEKSKSENGTDCEVSENKSIVQDANSMVRMLRRYMYYILLPGSSRATDRDLITLLSCLHILICR